MRRRPRRARKANWRMVTRRDRSERTRRRILKAATKLFARHGYDRTSTASIARKAGVSEGIIFHHFETKERLFFTIVREGVARKNANMEREIEKETDPLKKIRLRVKLMAQMALEEPELHEILARHAPAMEMNREKIRNYGLLADIQSIVDVFDEGKKAGVFRKIDARTATFSLIGIFNITYLHWLAFGRNYDLVGAVQRALDMFLFGVVR